MYTKSHYLQIADALEDQIRSMGSNSLLPTEQQLSKRFEVSRVTVRRALGYLQRKGLIARQRGRGTIVNPPKVIRHILPVSTIEQDLHDQGLKVETQVCHWEPNATPPDHIRARLKLPPHASAGYLSLSRAVDDRVICHDQRYIPARLARKLDPEDALTRPVSYLLQELMGLPLVAADWDTEITPAVFEVARTLLTSA